MRHRLTLFVLLAVLVGVVGSCAPVLPTFDDLPTLIREPAGPSQSETTASTSADDGHTGADSFERRSRLDTHVGDRDDWTV